MKTHICLVIGLILAIFLVSGCTGKDLTPIVKNMPQFQEFLKDHPNANIQIIKVSESYISENLQTIKAQCGDELEIKPYYKVTITENNTTILAYLDTETQELICLYKPSTNQTGASTNTTSVQNETITNPPNPSQFAAIAEGFTKDKVLSLLGEPIDKNIVTTAKGNEVEYWYYNDSNSNIWQIGFSNGKVSVIKSYPSASVLEPANYGFEDYPAPFITNDNWNGVIVVGSDAPDSDIIGATDIAATLAQSISQPTPTPTPDNECNFMNVDDTMTISGHTVKLIDITTLGTIMLYAIVDVDGTRQSIIVPGTATVNGLQIEVKSAVNSDTKSERSATLGFNGVACDTEQSGATVITDGSSVPVAVLDIDLTSAQKKSNLIIIGGSDVNRLTAEIAGVKYPTSSYCDGTLDCGTGAATMMLYKNPFNPSKTILIINGDPVSKRNAASVLKDYTAYSSGLKGTQLMVSSENGVLTVTDNSGHLSN